MIIIIMIIIMMMIMIMHVVVGFDDHARQQQSIRILAPRMEQAFCDSAPVPA
jgi:hypothetical protein